MEMKMLSRLTLIALAVTLAFTVMMADESVYAAGKKYSLPKEIWVTYLEDDSSVSLTNIKYDKFGNLTSANVSEMIPVTYDITYKNKKGVISSLTYGNGESISKKTYDTKGRLTKVKAGSDVYKYKTNKKGTITKVTLNGDLYYKVKSIKYQKNGFVSKVVYGNGNVNNYNSDGLMSSAIVKGGPKFTYKYTKKGGKIVKALVKRNGKKYKQVKIKYGKSSTKDLWKYSCAISAGDGPSNAIELYSKCSLSGTNAMK